MTNENVEMLPCSSVATLPSYRLCASGGREAPLRGSFLSDSESLPATRPFWFSLTGYLWCQQLMCPCLREFIQLLMYFGSLLPLLFQSD